MAAAAADALAGFHSQVASVMEVLANAAVAEICKLVDEGYALLRLEVSRRQKENRVLRRRIRLMEMKMARGWPCSVTGKDPFADDNDAEGSRDAAQRPKDRSKECAGVVEEGPEPPFIKQENCGDDSIHSCPQEELEVTKERTVELAADAGAEQTSVTNSAEEADDESRSRCAVWELAHAAEGGAAPHLVKVERSELGFEEQLRTAEEIPAEEIDTGPACRGGPTGGALGLLGQSTEELPRAQRSELHVWERCKSQKVLKALPEKHRVELLYVEPEPSTDVQSRLSSVYLTFDAAAQQKMFLPQGGGETDVLVLAVNSELHGVPVTGEGGGLGMSSAWTPDLVASDSGVRPPHPQPAVRGITEESSLEATETLVNEVTSHVNSLFVCQSDKVHGRVGTKEKRFFCTFCGKGFNFPKQVEIHQRVHTGEKPFSCAQCRKQFSHSGNLKRHQRVHTGEKPFSCTQCDKRFSHLHQLKMHQRVHSGERPFSCTYCGKSYAERSYLRIHQQRNHTAVLSLR
ncbi:zinc finger and SCAN domain-containing protein 2-like isoform X2 [Scleropages formosus]|uniref:zinc finger and SCAN domain-containing protein 2-like isoform X2 n=1 Tax=Scleropages formosus TaxID=113540 RepID=UPI0010FA87BD|nr:zinc finger and SCAN domain-containing protein 2-like isoform X2 [Scleropages formosus]